MKSDASVFEEEACWSRIQSVLRQLRERRRRAGTIVQAAAEIERVLDEHVLAEPNTRALSSLKRIANRIPARDRKAREAAFEIYDRATLFYSEDHEYLLDGGAAGLYEEMRVQLLERLRDAARTG